MVNSSVKQNGNGKDGFERFASWGPEQINARLDEISRAADARRGEGQSILSALGGATMDYMTPDELAEMHALKLALPSQGELVAQAQARVAQRVAARSKQRRDREQDAAAGFKDTEFMSASDKARVREDWIRLLDHVAKEGVSDEMPSAFTNRLYEHIHMHCGHIAHHCKRGFWMAQLSTAQRALAFIEGMAANGMVTWTVYEYRDINSAMLNETRARLEKLQDLLNDGMRTDALKQIQAIALSVGFDVSVDGKAVGKAVAFAAGPAQAALF